MADHQVILKHLSKCLFWLGDAYDQAEVYSKTQSNI